MAGSWKGKAISAEITLIESQSKINKNPEKPSESNLPTVKPTIQLFPTFIPPIPPTSSAQPLAASQGVPPRSSPPRASKPNASQLRGTSEVPATNGSRSLDSLLACVFFLQKKPSKKKGRQGPKTQLVGHKSWVLEVGIPIFQASTCPPSLPSLPASSGTSPRSQKFRGAKAAILGGRKKQVCFLFRRVYWGEGGFLMFYVLQKCLGLLWVLLGGCSFCFREMLFVLVKYLVTLRGSSLIAKPSCLTSALPCPLSADDQLLSPRDVGPPPRSPPASRLHGAKET